MFRLFAGAFALALLTLAGSATAQDNKDKKADVTVWVRDVDGLELRFKVGKETGAFVVTAGDNGITATGRLTVKKDMVTFEVTEVKEVGSFPSKPSKGDKLMFKWVVKGDKATISDLTGDIPDEAKAAVEGEYKKK